MNQLQFEKSPYLLSHAHNPVDWLPWGQAAFDRAGEKKLAFLAGAAADHPGGHGFALLVMLEALWPGGELVCAAQEAPGELSELLRSGRRPNTAVVVKTPGTAAELAELAPYTADIPLPGRGAKYYLCRDGACRTAVDSVAELEA